MSMSNYPNKGVFCRRLREVTAMRVGNNNEEQLQAFVLGGKLTKGEKGAVFMFVAQTMGKSKTKIANEGDWIVSEDGFAFDVLPDSSFRREYEPK